MQQTLKNDIVSRPLPMTREEMDQRKWDRCDIILISGDAYVDHPSFGTAIIGRVLESLGYRVGIIAQPDFKNVEAFRILGPPKLFWGITAGNVDSQLARLTVMRKLRHDDAHSPGGQAGKRPANASIVYSSMARQAFKGVPVILGGIEASLRRFAYYDYWTDKVRRSLIFDAKADLIAFGMAEASVEQIAKRLCNAEALHEIPGTVEICRDLPKSHRIIEIPSYEAVSSTDSKGTAEFSKMTRLIIENHHHDNTVLVQKHGDRWLVVNPPSAPLETGAIDRIYSLPFTRRPHPSYGKLRIPAYNMIKDSITTHRGCYSGCSFCAINAHQGQRVTSRSSENILDEIRRLTSDPEFHGTISDIGGPTANMYGTKCRMAHSGCIRNSCLFPSICQNLNIDHGPLLNLMRSARQIKGVKHVFVTSGIRFDLALAGGGEKYIQELVDHHVCGLLKIAPEHISSRVLNTMHKPGIKIYRDFVNKFVTHARNSKHNYSIIEYFMSGHPGCTNKDMIELALYLRKSGIRPEQVQDFYPAPLTVAASIFYTGMDPITGNQVYTARTDNEKAIQRAILLSHMPEFQRKVREALYAEGRTDLIGTGPNCLIPQNDSSRFRKYRNHTDKPLSVRHQRSISKSHTSGR